MPPKQRIVLCVDDDPDDQLLVLDTIRQIDPTVRVATAVNGLEALRFLEDAKQGGGLPCLVIMDINMPLVDGKQALVRIKKDEVLAGVPVVLFTTSSSALDRSFAAAQGAELITKPVSQKELYKTVSHLLSYCTL
jgi:CheY-like chemotaxis protein